MDQYPYKDQILKGSGASGGGAGGRGGGQSGARSMRREQFSKLSPTVQMAAVTGLKASTLTD